MHLGIRPHRIRVAEGQGLTGTVVSNQWLGDQSHLGIEVQGCFLIAVEHRPMPVKAGETVPVTLPLDAMHLFDGESEVALLHGLGGPEAAAA